MKVDQLYTEVNSNRYYYVFIRTKVHINVYIKITIENSYEIAKEYVYSLNDDYYNLEEIRKAFDWITKNRWTKGCNDYLSKLHKGDDL